jgi:glutaredoxin 3
MAPVTLYSTMMCPYCFAAENLLKSKGMAFKVIDVTMNPVKRAAMREKSGGRTTVPQIFIGEVHVGGFDELSALDQQGKLNSLLGI